MFSTFRLHEGELGCRGRSGQDSRTLAGCRLSRFLQLRGPLTPFSHFLWPLAQIQASVLVAVPVGLSRGRPCNEALPPLWLKTTRCVPSPFRPSEAWSGLTWTQVKAAVAAHTPLEALRENPCLAS